MAPIQVKWLHNDGFRRFELEMPSYSALMEAIRGRIPTFQGGICYTDAEGDKILITCDLDFRDMLKYFRKGDRSDEEVVVKIQTNECRMVEQSQGATAESPAAVTSSTMSKTRQKIEVIELLESADERNSPALSQRGGIGQTQAQTARVDDRSPIVRPQEKAVSVIPSATKSLMQEMDKIIEKGSMPKEEQFHNNELEMGAGHSSWFDNPSEFAANLNWNNSTSSATANVNVGVMPIGLNELSAAIGGNQISELDHRMWQKRKGMSNLINCTECGASVTNENSSLKLHVNLHHLKLPIFACKYCWKVEHKFSRANMIRHMLREHADKPEMDFEHNSTKYRTELFAKIDECFPEASAERRKLHNMQQYQ